MTYKCPAKPVDILKYENFGHTSEVPFVIYADLECILVSVDNDAVKSTRKVNKHVPFGFACLTVSSWEKYNQKEVVVYSDRMRCLDS